MYFNAICRVLKIIYIWYMFTVQVQYGYEQAKADKERAELEVMKLNRELEKLQYQVRVQL